MSLIIVDTETTGLDPVTEQVFEVAAYNLDTDTYKVWTFEPSPSVVVNMHPKAAEVNRYHERTADPDWTWTAGLSTPYNEWQSVLRDLSGWLDGNHILGAVPDFDARHLTKLFEELNVDVPRWHYHLIDIEAVAVGYMLHARALHSISSSWTAATKVKEIDDLLTLPYKSDDLADWFGVEPAPEVERHTALGDVMWTKRWWEAMQ